MFTTLHNRLFARCNDRLRNKTTNKHLTPIPATTLCKISVNNRATTKSSVGQRHDGRISACMGAALTKCLTSKTCRYKNCPTITRLFWSALHTPSDSSALPDNGKFRGPSSPITPRENRTGPIDCPLFPCGFFHPTAKQIDHDLQVDSRPMEP